MALLKMGFQKSRKTHWKVHNMEFFLNKAADIGLNF